MYTITTRTTTKGVERFTCQMRIRTKDEDVSVAQTFGSRKLAEAWGKKREKEFGKTGLLRPITAKVSAATFGDAIRKYLASQETSIGRTKKQCLETIRRDPIADMPCDEVTSNELFNLAERLRMNTHGKKPRAPATVANYMSHLGPIFEVASIAWRMPLDRAQYLGGLGTAWILGVAGKSEEREVRPTKEQLDLLMEFFLQRPDDAVPMHKIVPFAIASTRRQSEVVKLRWEDLDEAGKRILVRDMKHPHKNNPRKKVRVDVWCYLTDEALAIILSMPRVDECIFPFSSDTISAAFTRACQTLKIENLHYHDLRHDGISRLFEMGWTIPQVQQHSAHRTWASLQRYAHPKVKGDIYTGWKWWEVATAPLDHDAARATLSRREIAKTAANKRQEKQRLRAMAAAT